MASDTGIARAALLAGLALTCVPGLAVAQAQQRPSADPAASARMHVGPLRFTPIFAISGIGVDTNVFNTEVDPKKDFTATVAPRAQYWLKLGKARLSGNAGVDYVHFQTFSSERALNTRDTALLELPFNHLTAYVSDAFTDVRERPGYEIDARARYLENTVTLGSRLRLGGKSTAELAFWNTSVTFNSDAVFAGTELNNVLNRDAEGVRLSMRHNVTPLTKLAVDVEAQSDRFKFSPARNADSVRVMSGLDFDPFTIISGSLRLGFRKYDAIGIGARGFRGAVANGDVGYRFLRTLRLNVHVERDLAYSYDVSEPYYVQSGFGATLTRRVTSRWDVQGTGGRYELAYQQVRANATFAAGRTDTVRTFGVGAGYTLRPGRRIGLELSEYHRGSDLNTREYNSVRLGTSLSYGF